MHKAGICCSFGTRRASWLFLARLFPPSSDTICLCKTLQLPSVNFTVNTQLPRLLGKESSSARPWPLLEGAELGREDLSLCHWVAGRRELCGGRALLPAAPSILDFHIRGQMWCSAEPWPFAAPRSSQPTSDVPTFLLFCCVPPGRTAHACHLGSLPTSPLHQISALQTSL